MAQLKFIEDDEGNATKEAIGMYSKEGEYVDFDKSCNCSGQVICARMFNITSVTSILLRSIVVIAKSKTLPFCLNMPVVNIKKGSCVPI